VPQAVHSNERASIEPDTRAMRFNEVWPRHSGQSGLTILGVFGIISDLKQRGAVLGIRLCVCYEFLRIFWNKSAA
jgi:hypothetical protein